MKSWFISFLLFIGSFDCFSCSCGPLPELSQEEVSNAKVIFIGIAEEVKIDSSSWKIIIKFRVIENIKGTKEGDLVQVTTNTDSGTCGLRIKKSEKWYIFSSYISESNNLPSVSVCGRNVRLTKRKYKRKELGRGIWYLKKRYRQNHRRFRKELKYLEKLKLTQ